ncbi:MAG: ATP-grasp domain-containing protein [Verrucomicrobiota bacterium]|nr:ATP-grasp domain-containing protein [Verrucomicrobiota bacterium]
MITLLITGVGGPLGQALIKAARRSAVPCRVLGSDRVWLSIGLDWVDKAYVIPDSTHGEEYIRAIREICEAEKASLVLPGSDGELQVLSDHAATLQESTGAVVVASPPAVLRVAMDKWETCRFLEHAGLNFPRSAQLQDNDAVERLVQEFGFPLIAKPRRGSGSRGLYKLRTRADLEYLKSLPGEIILQEYLQPDEEEYTVAVYTLKEGGTVGSISFKRELLAGNTYRAWVSQNAAVQAEAEAVVEALRPSGPCNVQLRLTARGAVTFEINSRFSGTTAMRAHFGYNEVEMAIRDLVLGEPVPKPIVKSGIAMRFWDESYFDPERLPGDRVQAAMAAPQTSGSSTTTMRILQLQQAEEWSSVLERSWQYDFYHLPAYHAMAEQQSEGTAHLFVYEQGDYMIAVPLLVRSVSEIPGLQELARPWKDATSVYGYAGPISSHANLPEAVAQDFKAALRDVLKREGVTSVFSRLHPLLAQIELLSGLGEVKPLGETISIDLKLPAETQWQQFRSNHRKDITKLQRLGIVCHEDQQLAYLDQFVSVYRETMRRVAAHDYYFFDRSYFEDLIRDLGSNSHLFIASQHGEAIAGGLFIECGGILQYHLGGSRDEYLKLGPMKLLIDSVRRWASEKNLDVLHLGGGVGSQQDSLFRFKAGFSDRRHSFTCWRWIVFPEIYRELCETASRFQEQNLLRCSSPEYFPEYRSPLVPEEQSAIPGITTAA